MRFPSRAGSDSAAFAIGTGVEVGERGGGGWRAPEVAEAVRADAASRASCGGALRASVEGSPLLVRSSSFPFLCVLCAEGDASRQSRSEKKSRKAVAKLGMKPFPGIRQVQLRRGKGAVFVINHPDIFKAPGADSYVVFGEAKAENPSSQFSSAAAEQLRGLAQAGAGAAPEAPAAEAAEASTSAAPAEAAAEAPAADLKEEDIELVANQTGASRDKVVAALTATKGDVVSAIMELTE